MRAIASIPPESNGTGEMPENIAKYRIERFIGKGATGAVYLAVDPFSEREVAIKVMEERPDADVDSARLQQRFFQTEAALAGKLRHPHIATILDAGVDGDTRYLVMEYIDGGSLADHCDGESGLPVSKIAEFGFKCCKALEYANQMGVVHRDLKPANIMLTRDFDIKISDFGAAMLDRAETTQVLGVGSPAYMSPEQIQGGTLNFQTDIFSLGAVLYHLLTGRRPFNGGTVSELLEQITGVEPPPPSAMRHDVPLVLDEIIARTLAKSREQRYASWEELANALEALLVEASGETLGLTEAERFNAMRRLSFFRTFSEVELWEVVRQASWRKFEADEALIREGEHDEGFYVLASGMAKVTARGELLNIVSPGESVGEFSVIRRNGPARMATVSATEPSWAIGFTPEQIDSMSNEVRARFSEAFLGLLVDRISLVSGRLLHALQEKKIAAP
ncbi:MAG TPA: serine/threonine-protein kinase [Burkholderiales bacterium]|nr:serine/threonine-protein kinase [Burkholderiales bacterium]